MEEIDLIDIKELLYTIWTKRALVFICLVLGIVIGLTYTVFMLTPMYESSTTLVLTGTSEKSDTITSTDLTLNSKLVSTYSEIIKSRTVADQVIQELGLNMSVGAFKNNISVTSKTGTEILVITVSNEDGEISAKIANKIAEVFSAKVKEMYHIENVSVIDTAIESNSPYNISFGKNIVIFAFGGVVIALAIIFIGSILDNTVKTQEDVERLVGISVIAVIPKMEE